MSRRWTGIALVAASALMAPQSSTAAGAADAELPRAACTKRLADPEGDAKLDGGLAADAGLDITGLHLRLTPDELQVFAAVKDIPAPADMAPDDTAFRWTVTFKFGTKTFEFAEIQLNPNPPYNTVTTFPTDKNQYPKANTGTGTANELPGFTRKIDVEKNYVVFTAPRARVEQNLGGDPLKEGDKFESLSVKTQHNVLAKLTTADETTVPAAEAVWVVGDEYCFGPPPAKLSDLTVTPATGVQFTDAVTLSAKLVSEKDEALADQPVQFAVQGEPGAPLTGTTNAEGIATVKYTPKAGAGTYAVTASFAGTEEHGKAKLTGTNVVVTAEKTKFAGLAVARPNATARVVTATLLDDDNKPVVGQRVDWYVNGRKVATTVTNGAGKTAYSGARATNTVQTRFAGLAGKYLAAASTAVKV